jgi:hypothetical protein
MLQRRYAVHWLMVALFCVTVGLILAGPEEHPVVTDQRVVVDAAPATESADATAAIAPDPAAIAEQDIAKMVAMEVHQSLSQRLAELSPPT